MFEDCATSWDSFDSLDDDVWQAAMDGQLSDRSCDEEQIPSSPWSNPDLWQLEDVGDTCFYFRGLKDSSDAPFSLEAEVEDTQPRPPEACDALEDDFEIPIQQKKLSVSHKKKRLPRHVPLELLAKLPPNVLHAPNKALLIEQNRDKENLLKGELQFDPTQISEQDFDTLLSSMKEKGVNDTDKDRIFYQLHLCQYQKEKVIPLIQQSTSDWTEVEKTLFETCMEHSKVCPKWLPSWKCGNPLHEILFPHRDWSGAEKLIKTKTQQQIVEYYWLWKKSERRRKWLQTSSLLDDLNTLEELETALRSRISNKRKLPQDAPTPPPKSHTCKDPIDPLKSHTMF
jgi:hypothetical protein